MGADQITISLNGAPFGFPPDEALRLLPEWLRIAADKTDRRDETTGLVRRPAGHGELLRWLADRVEGKPLPRIPEPGMWGVVRDGSGDVYIRNSVVAKYQWSRVGGDGLACKWDEVADPVLVREGVES